jgi:hypothetical protein
MNIRLIEFLGKKKFKVELCVDFCLSMIFYFDKKKTRKFSFLTNSQPAYSRPPNFIYFSFTYHFLIFFYNSLVFKFVFFLLFMLYKNNTINICFCVLYLNYLRVNSLFF